MAAVAYVCDSPSGSEGGGNAQKTIFLLFVICTLHLEEAVPAVWAFFQRVIKSTCVTVLIKV